MKGVHAMAETQYRVTLWSGGKAVMQHYTTERPKYSEGRCAVKIDENSMVHLIGTISIEEGAFAERPISGRIGR
jgi:hypothetical protein